MVISRDCHAASNTDHRQPITDYSLVLGLGNNIDFITLSGGTVTVAAVKAQNRIFPDLAGNGTLCAVATNATNVLDIGGSPNYSGDIIVVSSVLNADRACGSGPLTTGDITVKSNGTLTSNYRNSTTDPDQPFSDTTALIVEHGATVNWTYVQTGSNSDRVEALAIDGRAVMPGTYTFTQLNALAGRTAFTEKFGNGDADNDDFSLTVLNMWQPPARTGNGLLLVIQ
jgi:hypothetical protein